MDAGSPYAGHLSGAVRPRTRVRLPGSLGAWRVHCAGVRARLGRCPLGRLPRALPASLLLHLALGVTIGIGAGGAGEQATPAPTLRVELTPPPAPPPTLDAWPEPPNPPDSLPDAIDPPLDPMDPDMLRKLAAEASREIDDALAALADTLPDPAFPEPEPENPPLVFEPDPLDGADAAREPGPDAESYWARVRAVIAARPRPRIPSAAGSKSTGAPGRRSD